MLTRSIYFAIMDTFHPDAVTRLRRKPRPPGRGGMRVSFGGLRRTRGATGSPARGAPLNGFTCASMKGGSDRAVSQGGL